MDDTVRTLVKLLIVKKRQDLAILFRNTSSEISESTQYGSHLYSMISSLIFYSPVEDYLKLKELSPVDKEFIKHLILEIYPPAESSPEIVNVEYRMLTKEIDSQSKAFIDASLRLFISYSHDDAIIAGKIKNGLTNYFGIDVFLAHEDIEGGYEWANEIIANLKRTDIFVPLLSQNFIASEFTDQETGAVYLQDKIIVPVSLDGTVPYGFINKIQAIKVKFDLLSAFDSNWMSLCVQIVKAVASVESFSVSVRNSIIRAFANSGSFRTTQSFIPILEAFEPYNNNQINQIVKAFTDNDQIHAEAYKMPQFFNEFKKKHKAEISDELWKLLSETQIDEEV